MSNLVTFSIKH